MSEFTNCEKHFNDGDIDDFFAAVAREGAALQIAEALGASDIVRLERTPTPFELVIGVSPGVIEVDAGITACADAIRSGQCTQYETVPTGGLTEFTLQPRRGAA